MKRGEIYLVDFGESHGHVQSGVRPAVVVQNDVGNKFSPTTQVCPLTSQTKRPLPTHVDVGEECGLSKPSTALTEQLTTIDKEQIIRCIGEVDWETLNEINRKVLISLGLDRG